MKTVVVNIEAARQLGLSESDILESLRRGVVVATLINGVGANAESVQQQFDLIARAEAIDRARDTEILRMLRDIVDVEKTPTLASLAVTPDKIVHGPQRNYKKGKAKKW